VLLQLLWAQQSTRMITVVRYMISGEDLDGEYYDRVFGGEDSDSDMDMSDDDM